MSPRKATPEKTPPHVSINVTRKNKFEFIIFYIWNEEREVYRTRTIFTRDDDDFLMWMFEFINVFNIQPIARDEYIKERIENLIYKKGWTEKLKWKGKFQQSKEQVEELNIIYASFIYTIKDIINYIKPHSPGFSERTFRFYQSQGLIPKTKKRKGKHKVYPEQTIKDILRIIDLQAEEKTIKQIKEIINNDTKYGISGKNTSPIIDTK